MHRKDPFTRTVYNPGYHPDPEYHFDPLDVGFVRRTADSLRRLVEFAYRKVEHNAAYHFAEVQKHWRCAAYSQLDRGQEAEPSQSSTAVNARTPDVFGVPGGSGEQHAPQHCRGNRDPERSWLSL